MEPPGRVVQGSQIQSKSWTWQVADIGKRIAAVAAIAFAMIAVISSFIAVFTTLPFTVGTCLCSLFAASVCAITGAFLKEVAAKYNRTVIVHS